MRETYISPKVTQVASLTDLTLAGGPEPLLDVTIIGVQVGVTRPPGGGGGGGGMS